MMKNKAIDMSLPQTFITSDGKRVKRMIRHLGQGIGSHIIYKRKRYGIERIEGTVLWNMVEYV